MNRQPSPAPGSGHKSRVLSIVCLLVAALGGQPGCEISKACTAIGCGFAFAVDLKPADGQWLPGTYTLSVTADGVSGACEIKLPLAGCGTPSPSCTGTRDWGATESGCALPASQHSIPSVIFTRATPATVEISVSRDGRELARQTFNPTYKDSQPNGPDCEPTCRGAPSAMVTFGP